MFKTFNMKKILLLLTVITLVFSCKNEEKPIQNEQPIVVEEAPKQLELFITCKTDKTDKIEVIFNRIELKNNREGEYVITDKISSQNPMQEYSYQMFDDYIVTLVQLKLGKVPKNLIVDQIALKFDKRQVIIKGEELDKYFAMNKFVSFNKETKTLTTTKIDNKHIPILTLRQGFIKRLFNFE